MHALVKEKGDAREFSSVGTQVPGHAGRVRAREHRDAVRCPGFGTRTE